MSGDPYSKERQLARGARRYRRKVASPKQWQAIIAAKAGPCRVCVEVSKDGNGGFKYEPAPIEFHHLVPRDRHGDDVSDNIVPLCARDHRLVTEGNKPALRLLRASLTPAERAYMVTKLGEAAETMIEMRRGETISSEHPSLHKWVKVPLSEPLRCSKCGAYYASEKGAEPCPAKSEAA